MSYDPQDWYFRQAKAEGYLARSVYKLQAIDKRYRVLCPGMRVIDLGAAPGSWSQYAIEKVQPQGEVLAVDLLPLRYAHPKLRFHQIDVFSPEIEKLLAEKEWSGILSDMAPATTGSRPTDQARSAALVERSLFLAQRFVASKGFWIAKLLEGPDLPRLHRAARDVFMEVHIFRPPATRKGSTECFLIGLQKR